MMIREFDYGKGKEGSIMRRKFHYEEKNLVFYEKGVLL